MKGESFIGIIFQATILVLYLRYFCPYMLGYELGNKSLHLTFFKIPYLCINYNRISEVVIIPKNFFKLIKICIYRKLFSGNVGRLSVLFQPKCIIIYTKMPFYFNGLIIYSENPEEFVAELTQRIALNKINDEKNTN